jgi:hypothetical protein
MTSATLITLRAMALAQLLRGELDFVLTGRCALGCREDQPTLTKPCSLVQEVCS